MFKPGDRVRNPNKGRTDVVKSVPGMAVYDSMNFIDATHGVVLENSGWEWANNWELIVGSVDYSDKSQWRYEMKPDGNGVISVGHDDDGTCAAVVHLPCGRYFCIKSRHANINCVPITTAPVITNKKGNFMSSLIEKAKYLALSADDKTLRKQGVVDANGKLTAEGRELLESVLIEANKTALVAVAQDIEKFEKDEKKNS